VVVALSLEPSMSSYKIAGLNPATIKHKKEKSFKLVNWLLL
jgi:hypothetical protein